MARPQPWYIRAKVQFLRFWKTENPKVAGIRDIVVAAGVVLLLLGIIWLYTGQRFPSQAPLVVVESGSMMHGPHLAGNAALKSGFDSPSFGRVGTIDPGDLVLVKRVRSFDGVETAFGSGKRSGYGAHGDVLVYKNMGLAPTPVIHRAMLKVFADPEGCTPNASDGNATCKYIIPETCNADAFAQWVQPGAGTSDWRAYCEGSSEPITFSLKRGGLTLMLSGYPCGQAACPPFYSGFITKGDNNLAMDQPSGYRGQVYIRNEIACCPIRLDWVVGKARGEIPWFGMIKLTIYGNEKYGCEKNEGCSDPTRGRQWSFFNATAPWDVWVCLFLSVGVLIVMPIGIDYGVNRIRRWRSERGNQGAPPPRARKPPSK